LAAGPMRAAWPSICRKVFVCSGSSPATICMHTYSVVQLLATKHSRASANVYCCRCHCDICQMHMQQRLGCNGSLT
jgi:hypothetical protein